MIVIYRAVPMINNIRLSAVTGVVSACVCAAFVYVPVHPHHILIYWSLSYRNGPALVKKNATPVDRLT